MSGEEKTVLDIVIRKKNLNDFNFLKKIEGFSESYTTSQPDNPDDYIRVEYFYKVEFGFWHKKNIKKGIKQRKGKCISFTRLQKTQPFNPKLKRALIASLFVFTITYLPAVFGMPAASSYTGSELNIGQSSSLALIS